MFINLRFTSSKHDFTPVNLRSISFKYSSTLINLCFTSSQQNSTLINISSRKAIKPFIKASISAPPSAKKTKIGKKFNISLYSLNQLRQAGQINKNSFVKIIQSISSILHLIYCIKLTIYSCSQLHAI
jgi:hypothetical protein